VHLSARRGDRDWVFTVADNGAGVPPGERDVIFRPFRRRGGRGRFDSGLGLATFERAVGRMSGRVWLEDGPGRGSRFCFTVPDAAAVRPLPALRAVAGDGR
jgi:signal transduction histidine kinase